jgi:hypothetical protein
MKRYICYYNQLDKEGNVIDDFSEWCSANSLSEAEDKFYSEYHKDIDSGKLEIVQVLLDD